MRIHVLAAAIVLAVFCGAARAAEVPTVPWSAVDGSTFVMGRVDLTRVTPAEMRATAMTIVGPEQANSPQAGVVMMMATAYHDMVRKAGVSAVRFSVSLPAEGAGDAPGFALYAHMDPGADPAEFQKTLASMGPAAAGLSVERVSATWQKLSPPGQKPAAAMAPDVAKRFEAAEKIAGDAPLTYCVVFTDEMRKKFGESTKGGGGAPPQFSKFMDEFGKLANEMESATVWIQLGAGPSLHYSIAMNDAAAAERANKVMADLKATMSKTMEEQHLEGPKRKLADAMASLYDVKLVGARLNVDVTTEKFKEIGAALNAVSQEEAKRLQKAQAAQGPVAPAPAQ